MHRQKDVDSKTDASIKGWDTCWQTCYFGSFGSVENCSCLYLKWNYSDFTLSNFFESRCWIQRLQKCLNLLLKFIETWTCVWGLCGKFLVGKEDCRSVLCGKRPEAAPRIKNAAQGLWRTHIGEVCGGPCPVGGKRGNSVRTKRQQRQRANHHSPHSLALCAAAGRRWRDRQRSWALVFLSQRLTLLLISSKLNQLSAGRVSFACDGNCLGNLYVLIWAQELFHAILSHFMLRKESGLVDAWQPARFTRQHRHV